jgi:ribosome biogenesis GTPase
MDELSAIHVEPIFISAATGQGMDLLRTRLAGKRTVLAGASGTGKSTIINALVPGALAATRPIRMKDQRGRHTTAAAAVYDLSPLAQAGQAPAAEGSAPYSGGLLVDTPGVRELGMEMEPGELSWYFPEFEPFARNCHFNDCSHTHEPQCAVITAVEQGTISARRYESYLRLAETIQEH